MCREMWKLNIEWRIVSPAASLPIYSYFRELGSNPTKSGSESGEDDNKICPNLGWTAIGVAAQNSTFQIWICFLHKSCISFCSGSVKLWFTQIGVRMTKIWPKYELCVDSCNFVRPSQISCGPHEYPQNSRTNPCGPHRIRAARTKRLFCSFV